MPEYIEREALVTNLRESLECLKEIYDGLKFPEERKVCSAQINTFIECILRVRNAPAADVVEVVRCKECKNFCPYEGEEHKGDCAELVGLESCVYEDDFCSYGERRKEE